jgi:SAM-dependent methyltransferase
MPDYPYPPTELADRVCCLDGRGDPRAAYEALGAEARNALLSLLPDRWSFDGRRVLDFGCGAGRTLRHFLADAQAAEFWGADIDAASIEWLDRNLCPPLHATRSSVVPPLGLDHGSFDLIWALSVFTHLTDNSLPWLVELHRLLKPGGFLIATYMGRWTTEEIAGEPWDEDRVGMNVLRHSNPWERGGPMVLMSDWWVEAHWGRAFEIVRIEPHHGQNWALMRKRDIEATVEGLERPEDDPREVAALRHNLSQVQREIAEKERGLDERVEGYERSLSWRITRPLRAAGRLARSLRP